MTAQHNPAARVAAQLLVGLCGAGLLLACALASDRWFWRHVILPNWYLPPASFGALHLARAAMALVGLLLLTVFGPKLGRWAGSQGWRKLGGSCLGIAAAVLLALVTSEVVVRSWDGHQPIWRKRKLEFRIGQPDEWLGWVPAPSRNTVAQSSDRAKPVHYRINAWGHRAASELAISESSRPSLIVTGESIAFGHGLEYEETFPAILGDRLGLQVVNVAVPGYGSDQAYSRLLDALDRLQRPVAVLSVFIPLQLGRSLQDYRPRLVLRGDKLAFERAAVGFWSRSRLRDLWVNELPYLSEEDLARAMTLTAAVVRATAAAALTRGAEPLFLVPSFGPARALGEHPEAFIVRALFERQSQPFVLIDIDPARIMVDDWHPDAAAARQIAAAVENQLRPRLAR